MIQVGENVEPRDTKGEGGYEDVRILKYLWRTAACMKRLYIATKGRGQKKQQMTRTFLIDGLVL